MKRILTVSILYTFTIVLSGCTSASSESAKMEEENAWMKSQIAALQEENAALLEEIQVLDPDFEHGEDEEAGDEFEGESIDESTDESEHEENN